MLQLPHCNKCLAKPDPATADADKKKKKKKTAASRLLANCTLTVCLRHVPGCGTPLIEAVVGSVRCYISSQDETSTRDSAAVQQAVFLNLSDCNPVSMVSYTHNKQ